MKGIVLWLGLSWLMCHISAHLDGKAALLSYNAGLLSFQTLQQEVEVRGIKEDSLIRAHRSLLMPCPR